METSFITYDQLITDIKKAEAKLMTQDNQYILIENAGAIDPEAFKLLGANAKPRSGGASIGFFGTGLKYSIAWLLAQGIEFHVFSGTERINITTEVVEFRGTPFSCIVVNGHRTSLTTDMAKTWEPWYILREIYSNAKDEGGARISTTEDLAPQEGTTRIYIKMSYQFASIMDQWSHYFIPQGATPLAEGEGGRIYHKLSAPGGFYRQGINVLEKEVRQRKVSRYSYDVDDCKISETRETGSMTTTTKIWTLVVTCGDANILRSVLEKHTNSDYIEYPEYGLLWSMDITLDPEQWREALKDHVIYPMYSLPGLLTPEEAQRGLELHPSIWDAIRGKLPKDAYTLPRKMQGDRPYEPIEFNDKEHQTLNEQLEWLALRWRSIPYEIQGVDFVDKNVLGAAETITGRILLSRRAVAQGASDLRKTLIEEYIHLAHGVDDNSRAMQDALLSELISALEQGGNNN